MDPLQPGEFASVVTAIASAFGDRTRRDIYLAVHSTEAGMTASQVAEGFELHPNVARHHLDKLCAGGYLEATTDRPAGSAGRPSRRYRAPLEPVRFNVPVRQDDLLVHLLVDALEELGPEAAERVASRVGYEYGSKMASAMGTDARRSFRAALQSTADALSSHGFGAHTESDGETLKLVTDHCPFGALPNAHPVICALDRAMVSAMMAELHEAVPVQLSMGPESGSEPCETHFRSA